MAAKVDRFRVEMSREARKFLTIQDTLSFIEDGDFLREFTECGLSDDDRNNLEAVITVFPDGGDVVPVTKNVRDVFYQIDDRETVTIRYVFLRPSTILLIQAYLGEESHPMPENDALEAEQYISHQMQVFNSRTVT